MIDLHCHLLPGIDDGPATLDAALDLARIAVADGITHAVMTPHIHPGRYDNSVATITPVFDTFQQALHSHRIALEIHLGAEVRIAAEMLALVPSGKIPFIGHWQGQQVMLLELPHSHIPPGSDKLVDWLLKQNILPMIAHPERNKEIIDNVDKLAPFIERGCLLQLTAMSVAGRFGEMARTRAQQLLENGWVTVLASDAHNHQHRPPVLSEGMQAAAGIIGLAEARKLVYDTPALLLHGHA